MFTRIIYTDVSPSIENLIGRSWQKILAAGLILVFAGLFVLTFPRLVAFLVALAFFAAAGLVLMTAFHLWQLSRPERDGAIHVD